MKTNIIILSLLLFISPKLFSQVDISSFDKWTGEWESTYKAGDFTNKEKLTGEWLHNRAFFVISITGGLAENPEFRYSSTTFLTLDNDDKIVGWCFNENGYDNIIVYKGKFTDNKVILSGKNANFTIKDTYELKDNKLIRKSEYKPDGGVVRIVEAIYTKK